MSFLVPERHLSHAFLEHVVEMTTELSPEDIVTFL